jgi:hypothetical protein
MLDLLVFILVVIVIVGAVIENIRLKNKNIELMFLLTQSAIDINSIKEKIENNSENIEQEHLIAFLTETRDMAYKYIEDLQKELITFAKILDQESSSPNDLSVLRIKKAFDNLESMKPDAN